MDREQANGRFAEADALFKRGAYAEALAVLDELYAMYPDEHRLLRARAETLAKLGRTDNALELCDRLLEEFQYEKIRPLQERLLRKRGDAVVPFMPPGERETAARGEDDEEVVKPRRFRVKPVRLLILIGLIAGMATGYVPYWLGGGLIVGYFVVRWMIGRALRKLFMVPFAMKGKALHGATAEVHGVTPAPPIDPAELDPDDEIDMPADLRWVYIDVTITPQPRSQGFVMYEAGEIAVAPASLKYRSLDGLDRCFAIHGLWHIDNGQEVEDDGMKYGGPNRFKLHVGLPRNESSFQFVYYTEAFGRFDMPAHVDARSGAAAGA